MSETSASKSAFDPRKFCECPNCFSVHKRGSVAEEIKSPAVMIDTKNCKYCHGSGFADVFDDQGQKLGVRKCNHQPPQGKMPF